MDCVDLTVAQASSALKLGELDNLCVIFLFYFFKKLTVTLRLGVSI